MASLKWPLRAASEKKKISFVGMAVVIRLRLDGQIVTLSLVGSLGGQIVSLCQIKVWSDWGERREEGRRWGDGGRRGETGCHKTV